VTIRGPEPEIQSIVQRLAKGDGNSCRSGARRMPSGSWTRCVLSTMLRTGMYVCRLLHNVRIRMETDNPGLPGI
jgi:hypothetical protein